MARSGGVGTALRAVARAAGRRLRDAKRALVAGIAGAAERLAYRRRELAVIGLLASSLLGGLAVEGWRQRAPATLERLEAEPPRPASPARILASRESTARRGRRTQPAGTPERAPPPPTPERPLDLNRATAADLARLPGIGPRLAARILAERDAVGGRFRSSDDLAHVPGVGAPTAARVRALVTVGEEASEREAAPEPAPDGAERREPP